jgi:NitT/TauT family transport system substrate-binding protein
MTKTGFAAILLFSGAGLLFGEAGPVDLRIGLMPANNSIPMVVGEARHLFEAQGIRVSLVPFSGQLERETALQTGALDGTVSDLINAVQSWTHGFDARVTSATEGAFALLGSPRGTLRSFADWPSRGTARVRTALLENSIVYYLTERMITSAKADLSRMELVPIVQLPARMEMLLAGKVDAACLPEPLASLAAERGAHVLGDSELMGASPGVLLFTRKAITQKPAQIAAFYRAYDAAVDEVNARPNDYRQSIVTGCQFPPGVIGTMRIPGFHHAFLPSEALVADVEAWMVGKGLVDHVPRYAEIVVGDFLPGHDRAE